MPAACGPALKYLAPDLDRALLSALGRVPLSPAAPHHPNARGMAAAGAIVAAAAG